MFNLILRRLIQLPFILAVIFVLTLMLVWVIPGSPLETEDARQVDPAVIKAMEAQYGLDQPTPVFAWNYLQGIVTGLDFGPSLQYPGQTVRGILADTLPVSIALGVGALAFGLLLGTTAGVLGALKPGSALETGSLLVALIGISLPSFVTGNILLAVFAGLTRRYLPELDVLHLPLGGWGGPMSLVLPSIALGLAPAAYIARLIRLGLADVMSSDFVRTARAKGLTQREALFGHALKVAFLPVLSFLGPAAASALTGSFVIEQVFNIPGLGNYFVNAVLNKDQFLLLAIVLIYSTLLIGFNLFVDVAYAWLDPRIELA
ncbi:MAG: ABC transporter permease [Planctomycetota bacterium]